MITFDKGELGRRVSEVLFYVWDPIGVSPEPYARGEYDSYAPQVLELLIMNETPGPIAELLHTIMTVNMALASNKDRCFETAEVLLEHKAAVKEGIA